MAVFDLDGTVTRTDTYTGILLYGLRRDPAALVKLLPHSFAVLRFALGRLDNELIKTRLLKAMFGGMPQARRQCISRGFVDRLVARGLRPAALAALSRHRAAGHRTVLLSASLDFYVEEIAQRLGFDHCLCTRTVRDADDVLSGALATPNCRGPEKLVRLRAWLGDQRARWFLVGYGDRALDFHLLTALDHGVVVSPNQRLARRAKVAGLTVVEW